MGSAHSYSDVVRVLALSSVVSSQHPASLCFRTEQVVRVGEDQELINLAVPFCDIVIEEGYSWADYFNQEFSPMYDRIVSSGGTRRSVPVVHEAEMKARSAL